MVASQQKNDGEPALTEIVVQKRLRLDPFVRAVRAHLAGERELELLLDLSSTAFQTRVQVSLRRIPYGETRSCAEVVAERGAGRRRGVREKPGRAGGAVSLGCAPQR